MLVKRGKEAAEIVAVPGHKRFAFVVACLLPGVYETRLRWRRGWRWLRSVLCLCRCHRERRYLVRVRLRDANLWGAYLRFNVSFR